MCWDGPVNTTTKREKDSVSFQTIEANENEGRYPISVQSNYYVMGENRRITLRKYSVNIESITMMGRLII